MSKMTSLEKDKQSRNRIVSEINTNFFVEAGAGSGKTTMLVSRMVAMVEAGIHIEEICAITFTKAAAGEFFDRFQKLLIERSDPEYVWEDKGEAGQLPRPNDETRALCSKALKKINLCFMGTIDSFCSMILSEHPSEADIPSDAGIVSDRDAEVFYVQQFAKICSGEYDSEIDGLSKQSELFCALHRNPEVVFAKGESVLMANRNVHFNFDNPSTIGIDEIFADDKKELLGAVRFLLDHQNLQYSGKNKDNEKAWEKLEDTYRSLNRKWSSNFTNVVYALKSLKNLRLIPEAMQHNEFELAGIFCLHTGNNPWLEWSSHFKEVLSRPKNYQYSASMSFLQACVPVLEKAMREKGNLTFFDCLYYLRNMLGRDAGAEGKLIRYISNRHKYYLLDEFQDTNPMQAEVFFYLSSDDPVSRWSDCKPRPGSLFIVGDPKQSIYRFRGADVTSFLKVKDLFEKNGGSILSLSRNFRSTSVLCDYFNSCFTVMMPEETKDQSKFEEIPVPDVREGEFQGVFTYNTNTGDHPETDPVQIAKIINRLVNHNEYLVRTGDDKTPRKLRYSDIMVITSNKDKLGPIMTYLDEQGIPTKVEGEVPFGENEALLEVFKIYSAVADSGDAMALYGALTGKLIRLPKEALISYRMNEGKVSLKSAFKLDGCTDEATCQVVKEIEALKELHYSAQRLSPAALFEKILDDYMVYKTLAAENLEVVYYTLELIRNAEKSGLIVTLQDGTEYIDELLSGVSDEERCLSLNDAEDAVHMANLHKIKGLEAPVVILAAAQSFKKSNEKRVIHGDDGSEGYLFSLSNKNENNNTVHYIETSVFKDEQKDENMASDAEHSRLVYVAATRARNVLIVYDGKSITKKGKVTYKTVWKALIKDGLPEFFEIVGNREEITQNEAKTVEAVDLYEEAERTCVLNDRGNMETGSYYVKNPSRLRLVSKLTEDQEANLVIVPEELSKEKAGRDENLHRFPALLGTMVHKLMEILVSAKNKVDAVSAVDEVIREYRTAETEPYEQELFKTLTGVAKKMRSGGYAQTNGLPQDFLGTLLNADEVYCEVPFCYAEDGDDGKVVWNGIMDVIYLSGGKWHIVDYKTNVDGNDLDKRYQAQLGAYIKAFKATTGEDADALTYHIDI